MVPRRSRWLETLSLCLCCGLLGPGCPSDKTDESGEDTDADADADADTDADADADTDADADMGSLTGTVLYEDDSPAVGVTVNLCAMQCRPAVTDNAGAFSFTELDSGWYAFDLAQEGYAEGLIPLEIQPGEAKVLDRPMYALPFEFSESVGSSAEYFQAGGGLEILAQQSQMTLPPMETDYTVEGVRLAPEQFPVVEGMSGTPVAMWYLGLWQTVGGPYFYFETPNDLGLKAKDTLAIYVSDYFGAEWQSGGTATVSSDGLTITSDDGCGIPQLTTLALVPQDL